MKIIFITSVVVIFPRYHGQDSVNILQLLFNIRHLNIDIKSKGKITIDKTCLGIISCQHQLNFTLLFPFAPNYPKSTQILLDFVTIVISAG